MLTRHIKHVLAVTLLSAVSLSAFAASPVSHQEQLSVLPFSEGRPSKAGAQTLRDELLDMLEDLDDVQEVFHNAAL